MRVHELPVVTPYRLDLTVSVLRRLSTNVVDLLTPQGMYLRALSGFAEPVIVRATQVARRRVLSVTIEGHAHDDTAVLALVGQMLGVDRDLLPFYRAAKRIAWLAPLVRRMRGVKPPRYPTLWEACANAIVFQQLSIRAASAIMHRLTVATGQSIQADGVVTPLYLFPTAERFQKEDDKRLRSFGLSANKIATLRRVAEATETGALDAATLEQRTSADAAEMLCRIKGIGPWTATIVLLRGLGRLDVFPGNDASVASSMALIAGSPPPDVHRVLDTLGPQRGMLYFHLLLGRLEARGDIGRPSIERPP
jgi:DNA-3-methyladenine glycosylase II